MELQSAAVALQAETQAVAEAGKGSKAHIRENIC
jgi:hypothetical protein